MYSDSPLRFLFRYLLLCREVARDAAVLLLFLIPVGVRGVGGAMFRAGGTWSHLTGGASLLDWVSGLFDRPLGSPSPSSSSPTVQHNRSLPLPTCDPRVVFFLRVKTLDVCEAVGGVSSWFDCPASWQKEAPGWTADSPSLCSTRAKGCGRCSWRQAGPTMDAWRRFIGILRMKK